MVGISYHQPFFWRQQEVGFAQQNLEGLYVRTADL